jgi:hypothetical protein
LVSYLKSLSFLLEGRAFLFINIVKKPGVHTCALHLRLHQSRLAMAGVGFLVKVYSLRMPPSQPSPTGGRGFLWCDSLPWGRFFFDVTPFLLEKVRMMEIKTATNLSLPPCGKARMGGAKLQVHYPGRLGWGEPSCKCIIPSPLWEG